MGNTFGKCTKEGENNSREAKELRKRGQKSPSKETLNISQSCPFLPGITESHHNLPTTSLSSSNLRNGCENKEISPPSSANDLTVDASYFAEDAAPQLREVQQNPPDAEKCGTAPVLMVKSRKHYEQEWSIADLVKDFPDLDKIPPERRDDILSSAKEEAWWAYPEFFYDFCLIASDDDYEMANDLRKNLCAKFDLTGCMLYDDDNYRLGHELFYLYERMMERSTKIFFYISENFNDNSFCRRIQSGAVFQGLMSFARDQREKCVPVFPKGLCSVHLSLSGIGGLEIPREKITEQRIKITYHEETRKKRYVCEQMNSEKRKTYFIECLNSRVKQYLEDRGKEMLPKGSNNWKTNEVSSSTSQTANQSFSSENHSYRSTPLTVNDIQKMLEGTTSAPVVSNSEVSVSAKKAHIGNNITLIINSSSHGHNLESSSSDSDLSSN